MVGSQLTVSSAPGAEHGPAKHRLKQALRLLDYLFGSAAREDTVDRFVKPLKTRLQFGRIGPTDGAVILVLHSESQSCPPFINRSLMRHLCFVLGERFQLNQTMG